MKSRGSDVAIHLGMEALVVVVSILAAFQLEEWRDNRAALRIETAQLSAIRADVLENQVRLDTVSSIQRRVVESGQLLLQAHTGLRSDLAHDSIAELLSWATSWWRLEPVTGAYDAMVNSGDVTRLRSQELLRELASFAGDLNADFEDQVESMDLLAEMRRIQMQYGLDIYSRGFWKDLGLSGAPSPTPSAVAAIIRDPRYAHLVAIRTLLETNRLEYYERLEGSMARMLRLLDQELALRGAT